MVLQVVKYGHPALRQRGARIDGVTAEIQQLVRDMYETMSAARGIGLAAQQVGRALQLMVIDVRDVTDRPSSMEIEGRPVEVNKQMPMALLNPQIKPIGPPAQGPEGCLSFPEIFAEIVRPEMIEVSATNEHGEPVVFRCGGLLSRAIQHEYDHLQGVLLVDRMSLSTRDDLKPELDALLADTRAGLKKAQPSELPAGAGAT